MIILQLLIILAATKLAGSLCDRLGQPSVLGEIVAGILLGPTVLGLVEPAESLAAFSQLGVILLMFLAGLETDLDEFKRAGKASVFVGFGGILVPLFLGAFAGTLLGLVPMQSWFLGAILSATSVSISVQTLKEMNRLKSREGTSILGAAIIDDIVVMIILAFLMSIAGGEAALSAVILKKALFFAGALLIARFAVPWIMQRLSKWPISEPVMTAAFIICFAFAYAAEETGVAAIIGAYIAGAALSVTSLKQDIAHKTEVIGQSVFVPVFFAYIGISAQFTGLIEHAWLIVMLSLLAIGTKFAGAGLGAKLSGFGWRSSMGIGSAMVSRGEVALIVAALGLETGLVTSELYAVLIFVVVATTVATPPLMKLFFAPARSMAAKSRAGGVQESA
jgi:monovalent cation:proton antiporter-2 (CPA2) family protein